MFKLVLIDDDAEVLAINQKYLTGAGFTVYTAISPGRRLIHSKESSGLYLTGCYAARSRRLPGVPLHPLFFLCADPVSHCQKFRGRCDPGTYLRRGRLSGQTLQSPGAESPGGPPDPQAQTTGAGFFRSGTADRKSFHRQGSPQGLLPGTGSVSRQPGI